MCSINTDRMYDFNSKLIKTDVTSVKIFREFVLCGIGSHLHLYTIRSPQLLSKTRIFKGFKIHGIEIATAGDRIVCHGENKLKIFTIDWGNLHFTEYACTDCSDWILQAKWLDSDRTIATVSMHNAAEFFTDKLELITRHECEEHCIVYCAHVSGERTEDVVVFGGTVFSEVLVWKPTKQTCPVSQRLKGHEGVLFSIDHNRTTSYTSSTSDDRSVILWQGSPPLLKHKMYGHTARVFGCKLLNDSVISIGEDGLINIWDLNGKLLRKLDGHQSGPIWVVDANENRNLMVTGGADTGVTVFPITPKQEIRKLSMPHNDTPKKIGLLWNNDVAMISEAGKFYYYSFIEENWRFLVEIPELKSYSLLEPSICRRQIALAGYNGHIFVYKSKCEALKRTCKYQLRTKSRIYALHWLTCKDFLTCGPDGILYLWRCEENRLLLLHVMQLPPIKERWSTAACVADGGIAVGDRKGNVHYFSLNESFAKCTVKKAHNHLGVTKLYYQNDELISLGRNSTIKRYKIDSNVLKPITSDKLPFAWHVALEKNSDSTFLIAFSGSTVILWDYGTRRTLLELNCGGGHRSWDFHQYDNEVRFVYIKDKHVGVATCDWDSVHSYNLVDGISVGEINSLTRFGDRIYFGGEDTTLRISRYCKGALQALHILKSHLSSIRCLCLWESGDRRILFSAGGRAQIIMWDVSETCTELHSFYSPCSAESEIRIMDMTVVNKHLLTACSDGKIKIYNVTEGAIRYETCIEYELRCILKITTVTFIGKPLIVTMATDGAIVFWDFAARLQLAKFKTHQSGINSFSHRQLDATSHIFLTGGDDNALQLSLFKFSVDVADKIVIDKVCHVANSETHCAQITGVYLGRRLYLSAALDQKVALFVYNVIGDVIHSEFLRAYDTAISDIKGVQVYEKDECLDVILYGLGIEFLTVS